MSLLQICMMPITGTMFEQKSDYKGFTIKLTRQLPPPDVSVDQLITVNVHRRDNERVFQASVSESAEKGLQKQFQCDDAFAFLKQVAKDWIDDEAPDPNKRMM